MLGYVSEQRRGRRLSFQDHERLRNLTALVIGNGDHRGVRHGRVRAQHRFQLGGGDLEALVLDQLLQPVHDREVPGCAHSTASSSAGATWKPLYLISSFNRSTIVKYPAASTCPMSPVWSQPSRASVAAVVWSQPSRSSVAAVASGLFR